MCGSGCGDGTGPPVSFVLNTEVIRSSNVCWPWHATSAAPNRITRSIALVVLAETMKQNDVVIGTMNDIESDFSRLDERKFRSCKYTFGQVRSTGCGKIENRRMVNEKSTISDVRINKKREFPSNSALITLHIGYDRISFLGIFFFPGKSTQMLAMIPHAKCRN